MKIGPAILAIALAQFLCAASNGAEALLKKSQTASKSNVIVILVDDMGWSDLGCYGSEIPTPNVDSLARNGVRFTQFYNTARCCPTRASLLTGLYPHQAGVGHMTDNKGYPGYQGHLNQKCVTIAEVLSGAGYFTAMSGKWHVGQNFGVVPWERGFRRSLSAAAGGFYFNDGARADLYLNGTHVGRGGTNGVPKEWYSTDLWPDYGLKFIDEARAARQPFFLYLPFNAPHFPLQAPPEDIAKFRGKYKAGWEKLRQERHARQIAMGIVDKQWPLAPRPPKVKPWNDLSDAEKDRFDQIMSIYAACVHHMDRAVGTLVDGLRQRGALDDTLIFFMSDNGGNAESGPNGRLEGKNPGDAKSTVFCGESWAWMQNTPFRLYKHFAHEGGISTPLIVHWPSKLKGTSGLLKEPGHLVDIMATIVDVTGADYPKERNGEKIQPMEGKSLAPLLSGSPAVSKPIFWEHEGNRAVRDGKWKLVALENKPWELYDLEADRTEQSDLSSSEPDRVNAMAATWDAYAARAAVLPLGGWRKKAAAGQEKLSAKTRFELKDDEHLERNEAPAVAGRPFVVTANFDAGKAAKGVLVAQGGSAVGYSLFFSEGKLSFMVRSGAGAGTITFPEIITGKHRAVAALDAKGTLSLALDNQPAVTDAIKGLLSRMPTDGLDVGADENGAVGPYQAPNRFNGKIDSIIVELRTP